MAAARMVTLLFAAWDDCDRVVAGLSPEEATTPVGQGSSFAWTVGHITNSIDSWINVRFQGRAPHPLIGQMRFRVGGTGVAEDWVAVQAAVQEVRAAARDYLTPLSDDDLNLVIPYNGSYVQLHATGLRLRDAVEVAVTHHYFHIGEIAAKRGLLGQQVGDYPRHPWSDL